MIRRANWQSLLRSCPDKRLFRWCWQTLPSLLRAHRIGTASPPLHNRRSDDRSALPRKRSRRPPRRGMSSRICAGDRFITGANRGLGTVYNSRGHWPLGRRRGYSVDRHVASRRILCALEINALGYGMLANRFIWLDYRRTRLAARSGCGGQIAARQRCRLWQGQWFCLHS